MAEGKLEPTSSEEPLPEAESRNFDLSDETLEADGNGEGAVESPEIDAQGEPEGIFALFDREFPQGTREPIPSEESSEFDREFSESFETMFTAVKGDGSAPLFQEEKLEELPEAPSREPELDGAIMPLPIPELTPEEKRRLERAEALDSGEGLPQPAPRGIPFGGSAPAPEEDLSLDELVLEEPLALDFDDAIQEPALSEDPEEAPLNEWDSSEDELEELNFDDSDEEDLYDTDFGDPTGAMDDKDEASFDEFAMIALGAIADEDDEDEIDEDEDFVLESLDEAKELDPFEEIAIMSSEDVAQYEPSFGDDQLKFVDNGPAPEDDPDPFIMDDDGPQRDDALPEELDPFSEEALALAEDDRADGADAEDPESPDDASEADGPEDKPKRRAKGGASNARSGFSLLGILLIPWKLYSSFAGLVFGLIEGLIGVLAKIPLVGVPFRILGSLLSAIPLLLKKLIVLALLIAVIWGGSSIVSSFLPKPSAEIGLPDSGSARIFDVELKEGRITGQIENTGEITLQLFPDVLVSERKLLAPGSWFNPEEIGTCSGELVEIPIDATVRIAYGCDLTVDGSASLAPSLRE